MDSRARRRSPRDRTTRGLVIRTAPLGVSLLAALLTLGPAVAAALPHGTLHERITALNERILEEPDNAGHYVNRGNLHRLHRDWEAAAADLERAAALDPTGATWLVVRGRLSLDRGDPRSALADATRHIGQDPDSAAGYLLRADVHAALDRPRAAADDLTRVIARLEPPRPEYYLDRAHHLARLGDDGVAEALRGLGEGLRRLGPVPALILRAVDLEVRLGRIDDALGRLDRLVQSTRRPETWLVRKGDVLRRAGRQQEARAAYDAARQAIEVLPSRQRRTRAMDQLLEQLQQKLKELER